METEASQAIDLVTEVLTTYGLRVIGAVVILIAGWVAAGWTARIGRMKRLAPKPKSGSQKQ